MGMASRLAAAHGKIACDSCGNPFGDERRIASFCDEPLEATCEWCDLRRSYERFDREFTQDEHGKIIRRPTAACT